MDKHLFVRLLTHAHTYMYTVYVKKKLKSISLLYAVHTESYICIYMYEKHSGLTSENAG